MPTLARRAHVLLLLAACSEFAPPPATGGDGPPGETAVVSHYFGRIPLLPLTDDAGRCASWRLDNARPLYVQSVVLDNEGSFHHSNWIVVPEEEYAGPDGLWDCEDRGFEEIAAAQKGTVLYSQSTQTFHEEQTLSPGAVVKIPPRHKIVGLLHTLNTSPRADESGLWLTLDLIHPKDVETIVTPLTMQYKALDIPAQAESRFTGKCDLSAAHAFADPLQPLDLRLHYILPHYHYLGNYFDVTVIGGEHAGESVYNLEGFSGEGNGLTFDPPLKLPGATGLQFTCGYDNWKNESVQWGYGDGEMCVLLALVDSDVKLGASVDSFNMLVADADDIQYYEGLCVAAGVARQADQGPPTASEREGDLYVPPTDPDQQDVPPTPTCRDADPAAPADDPPTLTSLRETVFGPSCTFSACHGKAAIAGLDLLAADLHAELLGHEVAGAAGMPLVTPGEPDESWLYQLVSQCEPQRADGSAARHMPLNAPILLDDALVAKLRAWIAAGAQDD
jgi:hypothetical protein